jgi:hypothetical protein
VNNCKKLKLINRKEGVIQDWKNREQIEKVSLLVLKLGEFLNKFGRFFFFKTKRKNYNHKVNIVERKIR